MSKKILVCLYGNDVAPRFDLTAEVLIATTGNEDKVEGEKTVVLAQASAEKLCHMILTEGIDVVICGGIEEEYYQYLTWKHVLVVDSVIGTCPDALQRFVRGVLTPGDILLQRKQNGKICEKLL